MNSRSQVYLFALLLILLGSGLTFYKHQSLGFPLTPGQFDTVWTIEATVNFHAQGDSIKASLALPDLDGQFEFFSESFSSSGFGIDSITEDNGQRRIVWTKRKGSGAQQLYYRLQLVQHEATDLTNLSPPSSDRIDAPEWGKAARGVARKLFDTAEQLSADIPSLTKQLLLLLNDQKNPDAAFLRDTVHSDSSGELARGKFWPRVKFCPDTFVA